MLRSLSFSGNNDVSLSINGKASPIRRLIRYFSTTELSGYKSESHSQPIHVVDDSHPLGLGNPAILKQILSHVETSDLIQLRLVNLRWNHISCEFLRRRLSPVRIRPSKMKQFLRLMKRCFCNPFGAYAIRIESLQDLQIKNFFRRFSLDIISLKVTIASDAIPQFFNRTLNKLVNLEGLHLTRIPEDSMLLRAEYIAPSAWLYGVYNFPKLKTIIFQSEDGSVPFTRNYDPILSQVVNSSPNLVKISFQNWDSHFSRLISRCGITNPKSLDIWQIVESSKLNDDLSELFFQLKMKFKALKFIVNESIQLDFVMEMTLQTSETLYHLALKNEDPSQLFRVSVKLRRLLTLGLQGWRGPVDFQGWRNQFPVLETVKLSSSNLQRNSKGYGLISNTVQSLTVMPLEGFESNPVDEELMRVLVKMFPNVSQLFVQVEGNGTLHVVYENWRNLLVLWMDLKGGEIGDEALTGIRIPSNQTLKPNGSWECGCCTRFSFPDKGKRSTSIGTLKNLQELIIRSECLTNIAFFQGILTLSKLQKLWFLNSVSAGTRGRIYSESEDEDPQEDFDDNKTVRKPYWCLRAIADRFRSLKSLVTPIDSIHSDEDIFYLRERLPELLHEFKY